MHPEREYPIEEFAGLEEESPDCPSPSGPKAVGDSIVEHTRNTMLTQHAGLMRRQGFSPQIIKEDLLDFNSKYCDPPSPVGEVAGIAKGMGRYKPGQSTPNTGAEASKWPEPLDEAAYFGLAGEIARAIEPHTEADPVAILIQILVAFGNVIGRGAKFVADGADHYMNLFVVLVGETSKARKGTSWAHVRRILAHCAEDWAKERIMMGLSSGEGLIWQVRDEIWKMQRDSRLKKVEEVLVDKGVDDKRLLVIESEFSSVLRVSQRDGNTLSAIIRSAWEKGDLRFMTKNSPAKATGAHVSIVGHIVKEELRRYLDRSEIAGGFGNRFLWLCVRRSKCLPDGGDIDLVDFTSIHKRLEDTITFATTPRILRRDRQANAIWHRVYPELSEGRPGLAGALSARSEAQVMRLAAIYAILDASDEIQKEHLRAALALWEYAQESIYHIFGSALGDPLADEILTCLRSSPDGLTRTDIRDLFRRNKSADQITRALEALRAANLADCTKDEGTGGRPAERWHAVTR